MVYEDLDALRRYVQWRIDVAEYERGLSIRRNELRLRHENRVWQAQLDFRKKNGSLAEDVQWGWCPIWRILQASKHLLEKLPPLPWSHDGMCQLNVHCSHITIIGITNSNIRYCNHVTCSGHFVIFLQKTCSAGVESCPGGTPVKSCGQSTPTSTALRLQSSLPNTPWALQTADVPYLRPNARRNEGGV